MARSIGVQFAIGAKMTSTVASTFATVDTKVKSLGKNLKELETVSARAGALMTANSRLSDAKAQHAASGTAKHAKELKKAEKTYRAAERAADKYNISVADSVSVHAKANKAIARTQGSLERQQKFQANAAKRSELQGQMLGTVATFAAVAVPIKLAIDFESAFADVKKVVDFGGESQEKGAQKDVRELSMKTGISAEGIAQIYAAAGESGIAKTREELQVFAAQASTMSVAFGISADDAGAKMASWRTKMGMDQAEVNEMADAINHLSNNMVATAADTSNVVERMGAVAKGSGLSGKSIAALSATFVAASPSAEIAATGMKNFLLTLTSGEQMTNKQREMFGRLGFDPKSLAKSMQEDAEGTITSVMEALAGMDVSEQGAALSALFGKESIGAIQPLLTNMDMLKQAFGLVADETDYTGSMQAEYESRSQTTEHALNQLKRTAESLGIALGSVVLPALTSVARGTATLIRPVIWLAETFPNVTKVVFGTIAALATLKVVTLGAAYAGTFLSGGWTVAMGVMNFMRLSTLRTTAALVAQRAIAFKVAAVTGIMAIKQWVLNAAMYANPIGVVILAVVALAAGLVWLFSKCEPVTAALGKIADGWNYLFGDDDKSVDIETKAMTEAKVTTNTVSETQERPVRGAGDMFTGARGGVPDFSQTASTMPDVPNGGSSFGGSMPSMPMPQSHAAAPAISSQITIAIEMNGVSSQDVGDLLVQGIRSKEAALQEYFTGLLNRVASEQGRLSYG